MADHTFTFIAHDRDRRNSLRDRSDEQVLAKIDHWPAPAVQDDPAATTSTVRAERNSEAEFRFDSAGRAAQVALGNVWADVADAFRGTGVSPLGEGDEVTVTITVKDMIATATMVTADLPDRD